MGPEFHFGWWSYWIIPWVHWPPVLVGRLYLSCQVLILSLLHLTELLGKALVLNHFMFECLHLLL